MDPITRGIAPEREAVTLQVFLQACGCKVNPDGVISTVAGGGTAPATDGTVATSAALNSPRNIAIDYYGGVYFSDFGGHRVYQLRAAGTLSVVAGTGEPGLSGDNLTAATARLNAPAGLAIDSSGTIYIADSSNGRIRKVWRGVITTLGDTGGGPTIPVRTPAGLALDPDGSLFVADIGGNQILRITPALASMPVAIPARDVVVDAGGNLYACSGPLVYRRPRLGDAAVIAGSMAAGYIGDGTAPSRARFADPAAVARDIAGNIYVADTGNQRVRKITPDGVVITVAGNGLRGYSGDGGPAVAAQLDTPSGVAVDRSGNLYIGDTGNQRIRKVDLAGNITTIAGTGKKGRSPDGAEAAAAALSTPTYLALDGAGVLYFSETGAHSVRLIGSDGRLGTVAGTGVRGWSGDGGAGPSATLDTPAGIAVDSDGNVFIADSGNRRIRRVSAPSSWGAGLISTFPDANAAIWRGLIGIALSSDGKVFVSDTEDARVFRVDGPGQVLTIAGTGVSSYTSDSGPALQQGLSRPAGIVVDPSGGIILADSANGRIRRITPVQDGIVITPGPPPSTNLAVVSAASLKSEAPIAPGQILSLFGAGLGPAQGIAAGLPASELGGTQVLFNGHLAALFYVSATQINLQAPYSIEGSPSAEVQVVNAGIVRARGTVQVTAAAPSIFTAGGTGSGPAAALNEDGTYNSETNPTPRGSVVVLFATGEGRTNPTSVEGRLAAGFPLPAPVLPVSVKVAGYTADVLFAGSAPGFAGLIQVNVRIPNGFVPPGSQPVTLQVGTAQSEDGVTIWLK